jgi:hypothetical protein
MVNYVTKQWHSIINERKTVDHAQNIVDGDLIESLDFVNFFATREMGGELIFNYNKNDFQAHYKFAYMEPLICSLMAIQPILSPHCQLLTRLATGTGTKL